MSIFRRNSRRLPGTLCDETPARADDASFHSRCATCAMPISFGFQPPTRTKVDARWVHDGPAVDGHKALPVSGRWQPAIPVHEVPEPRDDSEYDGPVTAYLRHLLDEMTADRDRLDAANGVLVAKVREQAAENQQLRDVAR